MTLTRRAFLKTVTAASGALAAGTAFSGRARAAARPNILFIYTDDQAPWTIGALGNAQADTPHLDRLFREGVRCENAFVTTPVCSPSRAGLLCSRYGTEVGITDWINPTSEAEHGLEPGTPSWVLQLREAGYRTGLVGKWHLGTQDRYHPTVFGYEHFAGFRPGGTTVENPVLEIEGEQRQLEGLTVDRLTDLALDFLRVEQDRPFLLSLHYRSPHRPWLPVAEEDAAPYREAALEIPDADYPGLNSAEVEQSYREYLSSVRGVDRNVGRILDFLEERGLGENTVVVFSSDHGYNVGHHGLTHKGNGHWSTKLAAKKREAREPVTRPNMFDTSLRVPLAVRWPARLRAGHRVTRTVTNLDWFPTLLAMADVGLPAGAVLRGRNFLPLLEGEDIAWEDGFYGQYSIHHTAQAALRMWRTPAWKLVRDFENLGRDELYHLAEDPEERLNLLHSPEAWEQYRELNARLIEEMERNTDPLVELARGV